MQSLIFLFPFVPESFIAERNRIFGAILNTFAALNTLAVADLFNVHFATVNARVTVGAFILVNLNSEKRNGIE